MAIENLGNRLKSITGFDILDYKMGRDVYDVKVFFPNGRGVSIVEEKPGKYALAILQGNRSKWEVDYDLFILRDEPQVIELLQTISKKEVLK